MSETRTKYFQLSNRVRILSFIGLSHADLGLITSLGTSGLKYQPEFQWEFMSLTRVDSRFWNRRTAFLL